ncbi:hypothetical protein [Mycoplasmopsis gallinarum]|uniref:hypothetical protein n=1 Tax=Mycoplasmopsis gallinarum TaxID=29557 RepID=UPI0004892319|nr:hypothetical protein [Mycoplasmopsis gallinarum]
MEQNIQTTKETQAKNKKIVTILLYVLLVIFLVLIAISIAVIADFYIYKNSGEDGLILSAAQRVNGIWGWL